MPEKPAACLVINAGVSTEPGGCTLDDVALWETLPAAPELQFSASNSSM
ncbi:hypothetical protein PI125_g16598 [Phytophthora idaei]|nr:hypothetical protein PI125_g16598 [Phytophthora idaei]